MQNSKCHRPDNTSSTWPDFWRGGESGSSCEMKRMLEAQTSGFPEAAVPTHQPLSTFPVTSSSVVRHPPCLQQSCSAESSSFLSTTTTTTQGCHAQGLISILLISRLSISRRAQMESNVFGLAITFFGHVGKHPTGQN